MTELETIKVGQGDAPKLTFRLYDKLPGGVRGPYVLTGATVNMIGKENRDDADGSAAFNYAGVITDTGADPGDEYSTVDFQVQGAHTVDVFTYFAKIVATKGGNPDTVKQLWLEVENT